MRITVQAVVHDDSDSIMSTAVLGVITEIAAQIPPVAWASFSTKHTRC